MSLFDTNPFILYCSAAVGTNRIQRRRRVLQSVGMAAANAVAWMTAKLKSTLGSEASLVDAAMRDSSAQVFTKSISCCVS